VSTQDFESGSLPANQSVAAGFNNGANGGINSVNPHTGTKSLQGLYASDGDVIGWFLQPDTTFNSDLYVSYWNFNDPNGTIPLEYFISTITNSDQASAPGHWQDLGWDPQGNAGAVNTPCSSSVVISDTTDHPDTGNPATQGQYNFIWGLPSYCLNGGSWQQLEIWYHPNTVTAGTANNDGFTIFYVNGRILAQVSGRNLNGIYGPGGPTPNLASPNGASFLEVGGVITAFCDAAVTIRANPFSLCPANAPSAYHRYIDDIIVMKK
jgi:hypothetical protein